MTIKWNRRLILVKKETVYGTDPDPVGTDAIEALEAEITPLAGDVEELELTRPYFGAPLAIPVNTHVMAEFGVPLAGSGAAGTAPAYAVLLEICGHAETVVADTSAAYDPVSSDEDSATLYFYVGPNLHAAVGCRGAITGISLPRNGVPRINFAITGLYVGPIDAVAPTPDFSGFQTPRPVSAVNTACTIHTFAGPVESIELEYGQEVEHRDLINLARVEIGDRRITGTIAIEAPDVADLDLFAIQQAATTDALSIVHGTAAGHIVEIAAPEVQITEIGYGESGGIALLELGVRLLPDAGDDDIKITFK